MNTVEHFKRLFTYDSWANQEVVAGLRAAKEPPARCLKLMSHILAAERLWLDRLEQRNQTVAVWPDFAAQQCENLAADLSQLWRNYLAATNEAELETLVGYYNTKGEKWNSRRDDILTHVVMHSAYHRGQIAAEIRSSALTPAYTDFIHGVRQGFVE